jgi:vancomycin resistance protein YoaR
MLEKIKTLFPKWLIMIIAIFLIIFLIIAGFYLFMVIKYENKILPNLYVGDINIGGLTIDQAKDILNKKVDDFNQAGVNFVFGEREANFLPLVTSADGDIAYQLINFDVDNTANRLFSYGRSNNFLTSLGQELNSIFEHNYQAMSFTADNAGIKKILIADFAGYEAPAENAKLIYSTGAGSTKINFSVQKEKTGKRIAYDQAIKELSNNLASIDNSPISLKEENDSPIILKKNCSNVEAQAQQYLETAPFTLIYDQGRFNIKKADLAAWLALKINPDASSPNKVIVEPNRIAIKNYLQFTIAPKIDKEPEQLKFEMNNGRVQKFQAGNDGFKLDIEKSSTDIMRMIDSRSSSTELTVIRTKNELANNNVDLSGIKEIIGTGQSNFKGSPKNRVHNIKVGANTLNGIIIKPGEKFSLVKTLGDITDKTGYLPELVIKGNKTEPEFGGGLCQIGTTAFRTALASGLPIIERRNHSYRVSYYEPAGTDATIYDPAPDLKFLNDTGNYILIQTRFEGTKIFFDFWGTKDGRTASSTYPTIYNIVKPEPTKIVETLDLPIGEKKCTEKAHNGADAYFDYQVTYPDGAIKKKKFSSHYIPWRAVCLIGVEKLSTPETQMVSTSTPAILKTN